jgi:hypothetical protein
VTDAHHRRAWLEVLFRRRRVAALTATVWNDAHDEWVPTDAEPTSVPTDPDDDGEENAEILVIRDAVARDLLQRDGFGHVGELWDTDPTRRVDYEPRRRPEPNVRELCLLCGWPLDLPRSYRKCEFPYQPDSWWREDRPTWCHCNGCLTAPTNRQGRPEKFCYPCKDRIKLARERAHRRAEGANSWSFDVEADRIANYQIAIRALAASRSDNYPRW